MRSKATYDVINDFNGNTQHCILLGVVVIFERLLPVKMEHFRGSKDALSIALTAVQINNNLHTNLPSNPLQIGLLHT